MSYSGEGNLIEGQIEGDPNKTVIPVAVDNDGHLIIDLDASTITIGTVDQGSSGSDPWAVKIDQTGTNNNVDANVTNFPANQNVTAINGAGVAAVNIQDGGNSLTVDGTVSVSGTVTVTGSLTDTQLRASPVPVSGSFITTPSGTQDVNIVSTIPVPVTDNGGSLTVDGTFFQATQPISGTVAVSNFPSTQPVSGSVSVSNFPATQPVSGTVAVSNFPATQPISGTVTANAGTGPFPVSDNGGSLTVDGPLTNAELRGTPVAISGSITAAKSQYSRVDTFTVTGNSTTIDASASCAQFFAVQVKSTGSIASAWDVRLEGSLDNTTFTQILQHTNVTGDGTVVFSGALSSPALYFRSRLASITLGLATNIVVTILGT